MAVSPYPPRSVRTFGQSSYEALTRGDQAVLPVETDAGGQVKFPLPEAGFEGVLGENAQLVDEGNVPKGTAAIAGLSVAASVGGGVFREHESVAEISVRLEIYAQQNFLGQFAPGLEQIEVHLAVGIEFLGIEIQCPMLVAVLVYEEQEPVQYGGGAFVLSGEFRLGSQVYQDGVSSVLQFRLDKAQEYLEANPDTVCIVTGGQGYNEPYPEAYGMKRYLVEHGIDSDRIIEEDTSASTVENIRNSMDIMKEKEYDSRDPDDSDIYAETRIGVVTNNYHTFRATHIAAALGLKNVYGLSGDIDPLYLPNNMVKEALSIVKAYLSGNI